jgi:uncharacterized protein YicC (UPF0701 family)
VPIQKESLDHFEDFRRREGESMRLDLEKQCEVIENEGRLSCRAKAGGEREKTVKGRRHDITTS